MRLDTAIPAKIPRAALVTGGSRRIGRAIALALAESGFAIALHARADDRDGADTASAIEAAGARCHRLYADLTDEDSVAGLIPAALSALGPIGVLVNNASVFERDEWDTATRASWDAHLEPNLRAPFLLAQTFAASLPAQSEGMILNLLDQRIWSLTPHFISYTVSKAGLWALTRSLALALAPRIRVNAIGPGPTVANQRQTAAQFARQAASVPLGHGSSPEEIGRAAIAMLALPGMTGQMIALDGGQHLQWQAPATPEHDG